MRGSANGVAVVTTDFYGTWPPAKPDPDVWLVPSADAEPAHAKYEVFQYDRVWWWERAMDTQPVEDLG